MSLTITSRFEALEGISRRVKEGLRGKSHRIVSMIAERDLDDQFRRQVWKRPQGGTSAWKRRHPLSTKTGPLLGGVGGSVRRSWRVRPSARGRVVLASNHPGAAVHRGSARGRAGETQTRILPKKFNADGRPLMWGALLRKGIVTSPSRLKDRGVVIPSRPHATTHPELRAEIADKLKTYWIRGRS
jgi:phage gpG-like protein